MQPPEHSVEDILASIRRIIVEDEPASVASARESDPPEPDDVLELTRPLPPEPVVAAPRPALVSAGTADASRQALAYLSSLKLTEGDPADDTLKGMMREMLRPMLKAWLDAELPALVERLVVQEIARLTAARG